MDEQDKPTGGDTGASTLDRLESYLSADDSSSQNPRDPKAATTTADGGEDGGEELQPADEAHEPTEKPEKADGSEPEDESPNEYQLSDLAKLLGADESALDVDEAGNVLVKTKIDGQEGTAKFADLVKSYQLQGHVDKQVREVAAQRTAVQAQAQALEQQIQVQQAVIGKIAEVKAIDSALAEYQSIDWQVLAQTDPQRALQLDLQMRDLQAKRSHAANEAIQAGEQFQQQQTEQMKAASIVERQALLTAVPEWSDPVKYEKDRTEIQSDLKSRGYTDADIAGIRDHKAVLLARDAYLYRKMKAGATKTAAAVRAAPKIIAPGSSQPGNRQATNVQNLKTAVRKSGGSRQSVADYLMATGKV